MSPMNLDDVLRRKEALPFSDDEIIAAVEQFETPFHLYSEAVIRHQCRNLKKCFGGISPKSFTNFFAVKATPTPKILEIMQQEGFGADCSSLAELLLAEQMGFKGEEIMFTSNNTPAKEMMKAYELGAVINFDDLSTVEFAKMVLPSFPDLCCFRFNPGPERTGNVIIGDPKDAKYGLSKKQLFEGYKKCKEFGSTRFALHTMVISNCLSATELIETSRMCFNLVKEIRDELGIEIEFVNLGGGVGIPYKPKEDILDLDAVSVGCKKLFEEILVKNGLGNVRIVTECGRYITGPAGYLVSRVQHQKKIYKNYVQVDACMANLMRPGMYGAYHHISVVQTEDDQIPPIFQRMRQNVHWPENNDEIDSAKWEDGDAKKKGKVFDVVGGLCENNDKFAVDRELTVAPRVGDIILIHDSGAHGHSMGFNYNGKLRSAEVLMTEDGVLEPIRRAEAYSDLFATIQKYLPAKSEISTAYSMFENLFVCK